VEVAFAHQFERGQALARFGDGKLETRRREGLLDDRAIVGESSTTNARLGDRTRTERSTNACTAPVPNGLTASPSVSNTLPAVFGDPKRTVNGGLSAAGRDATTWVISAAGRSPSR
jgi:hypothetical protein